MVRESTLYAGLSVDFMYLSFLAVHFVYTFLQKSKDDALTHTCDCNVLIAFPLFCLISLNR